MLNNVSFSIFISVLYWGTGTKTLVLQQHRLLYRVVVMIASENHGSLTPAHFTSLIHYIQKGFKE